MDYLKVSNCCLGCMYGEGPLSKCLCKCGGYTHGVLALKKAPVAAKCTPSVEVRCKSGQEDGECHCACGGVNHGLYQTIPDFENVRITGLATK